MQSYYHRLYYFSIEFGLVGDRRCADNGGIGGCNSGGGK